MRYAIVLEKGEMSYGAYVPDLPGCVAAGDTLEEVRALIAEAVRLHIEVMLENGEQVPLPTSQVEYVEVNAPSLVHVT